MESNLMRLLVVRTERRNPLIPEEAVHEAAKAMYWQDAPKTLAECQGMARRILEVAAPYMLDPEVVIEVTAEAMHDLQDCSVAFVDAPKYRQDYFRKVAKGALESASDHALITPNPYRSQV